MKQKPISELLNFSIINIDKPAGPTSFSVSDYVRKKLNEIKGITGSEVSKTSHFGTLDPGVTGCLPIALGRACRLTGFFLGHDKEYVGVMHTHKEQNIERLQEIINNNFLGKIKQIPPKKSRVKRQEREREIKRFELIEYDETNKDFLFIAEVQGGTYIRKLCSDLGELIGGAHMLELRRIRAGIFSEPFVDLYEFDKAVEDYKNKKNKKEREEKLRNILIPAEDAIKKIMPFVEIKEIKGLLTGKPLFKTQIKESAEVEKIHENSIFSTFYKKRFIGIYKKVNENYIAGKPEFVFANI